MRVLCLSSSLRPGNRTSVVAKAVADGLGRAGHEVDLLELSEVALEFCDGRPLAQYGESMRGAADRVAKADAYVIAMPVYCYSLPGVLKNFLDVAIGGMAGKPFAVVAVAGGERSYLACADLQRILQYEVSAVPYPRVVYASDRHFDGRAPSPETAGRLEALARDFGAWLATARLPG
jgi:NAD(P)H-dependent FMN reductase